MTKVQTLLSAIASHPHDDETRFEYADWIERNGDPERAEYIRSSCVIAQQAEAFGYSSYTEFEGMRTPQGILARRYEEWTKDLRALGASDITFDRGLPSHFRMDAERFIRLLNDLSTIAPGLSGVTLDGVLPATILALATQPWTVRLKHLCFSASSKILNPSTTEWDDAVSTLASSRNCLGLRGLCLQDCPIGPAGLRTAGQMRYLTSLRHLGLHRCSCVGDQGMYAIIESPALASLSSLDLRDCAVGIDATIALLKSSLCEQLEELRFCSNDFTDDWVDRLVRESNLRFPDGSYGNEPVKLCSRITPAGGRRLQARYPGVFKLVLADPA